MWLPLENMFLVPALIMVSIHLFSSFRELNGIELPLELLHGGVADGKSMEFARRINFPLANADNGVELPPNAEELNIPSSEDNDRLEDKTGMPKWLQMQIQPQPEIHQRANYHHHSNMLPKHTQTGQHHSVGRQAHSSVASSSAGASPLRRCSIEISSKIPGVCQPMGSIGTACVSGDYIDVFNAECL